MACAEQAADVVGESMKSLFLTKASAGGAGSQMEDLKPRAVLGQSHQPIHRELSVGVD